MSASVGIRELRNDLSRYLRRVRGGERLVVTDRNRPVALLTPLPEHEDPYERMIADGEILPATRPIDELPPPVEIDSDVSLQETLDDIRSE